MDAAALASGIAASCLSPVFRKSKNGLVRPRQWPAAGLCRRYLQRMDLTLKVVKLERAGEATALFGVLSCELKSGLGHSNAMPVIPATQRTGATD